ncbi:MAG TPA: hypothetical protein VJ921_07300, partial [Vicinamibacteria bacterium]|nr:hypothetical protein [Vicinamibacteria bacterium]
TPDELFWGGTDRPPAMDDPLRVLTVKKYGFRPGILVADSREQIYLLRFDPRDWPEMATGAEVVASRIFHALGYHVPESYIVHVERGKLVIEEDAERVTSIGGTEDLEEIDLDDFLRGVAGSPERGYRAVATRMPETWEGYLGPYQVFGTRLDDPNDTVPHEQRRELRGLFVFSAWLNHFKVGAVNTLDVLETENGVPFIRHYLADFAAAFGSREVERKEAWQGNERFIDFARIPENIAGMGIRTPSYLRVHYGGYRAVGRFEYSTFDPELWRPDSMIAPFANRLPDDTFWAAKQLAAFTEEDIRVLVSAGEYSDPAAEAWMVQCLLERKNRILATYFAKVLPLVEFEVHEGALRFVDLAVEHGFSEPRAYRYQWSSFDNETETHEPIGAAVATSDVPDAAPEDAYIAARVSAEDEAKSTVAYFRKRAGALELVGLEYDWPGKVLADSRLDVDTGVSRYGDLDGVQKELFDSYAKAYNQRAGFDLTPQEYFDSLTISERTTYDAVTHALTNTVMSDQNGEPLGRAIDLVTGIERIAGQYYGRAGDQQFRLYVYLKDGAREVLEKSSGFELTEINTVYHVGYPYSYRQEGLPSIQFSISEGGDKADIDVDYRSSKFPRAMFNGHLTSANSDVRAGDNPERHTGRWSGFVAWWREVFGRVPFEDEAESGPDLLTREPPEIPTALPPNRSFDEELLTLPDAAQEFLTDWLVRRNVDEASRFLSHRVLACVDVDDDLDEDFLRAGGAESTLRHAMEFTLDELGEVDDLTEAIEAVLPWRESMRVQSHPFEKDFAVLDLTSRDASAYLCGETLASEDPNAYGTYFGVVFRWRVPGGGSFGLVWSRENGSWRVVSYEAFEQ